MKASRAQIEKLRKWNWGAFLLAPIWALANRMEIWAILWFVPVVNIGVIFYLGYSGNIAAFERSGLESVDDFMLIQASWRRWAIRIFILVLAIGLVQLIIELANTPE